MSQKSRLLAALASALGMLSCAPGSSVLHNPADEPVHSQKPAIIFLHGYYGSALRDPRSGTRLFLRPTQTFWGSLPIALHAAELGARPSPALEVEGVFGAVTVLPYVYGMRIYTPLLNDLRNTGHQVVPFAYDWRQDLTQAAAELNALVQKLKAAGVPSVSLAAHSMGGLVASYYLGYGAQPLNHAKLDWRGAKMVDRVLYLGTPFRGAMSILRNLQHGTGYPWNPRLLEPETVASFPASYMLLPLIEGRFLDAKGAPVPFTLTAPATWKEWKLGYYHADAPSTAIAEARRRHSDLQVERASTFLRLLELKGAPPPPHLRVLNVVGEGKPTLAHAYAHAANHEVYFRAEELKPLGLEPTLLEEDGDGTVPLSSAAVPAPLAPQTRELRTSFAHDQLFLDPKIEKEYANFWSADLKIAAPSF